MPFRDTYRVIWIIQGIKEYHADRRGERIPRPNYLGLLLLSLWDHYVQAPIRGWRYRRIVKMFQTQIELEQED